MISKEDSEKAYEVLNQCSRYAKDLIKEHDGHAVFVKLLYLLREERHHDRGSADWYLTFGSLGLSVIVYCADGTRWNYNINTKRGEKYGYNTSDETTLELATMIAENWGSIKEKIQDAYEEEEKERKREISIISNFKL